MGAQISNLIPQLGDYVSAGNPLISPKVKCNRAEGSSVYHTNVQLKSYTK